MRKLFLRRLVYSFVILQFGLSASLRAETHEGDSTSAQQATDAATRAQNRFAEYDTLATKFEAWSKKAGEAKGQKSYDSEKGLFKVQLSSPDLVKAVKWVKNFKEHRDGITGCEVADSSSKALGETMDRCFGDALLSKGVKEAVLKENLWEVSLSAKDWVTCKNQITEYYNAKLQSSKTDPNKFIVDKQISDKFTKMFAMFSPEQVDVKTENSFALAESLKQVEASNWCQLTPTADNLSAVQSNGQVVGGPCKVPGAKCYQGGQGGYGVQPQPQPYVQQPTPPVVVPDVVPPVVQKEAYTPTPYQYKPNDYKYDPSKYAYQPQNYGYSGSDYNPSLYNPGLYMGQPYRQNGSNYQPPIQPYQPSYSRDHDRDRDFTPFPQYPVQQPIRQAYPPMFYAAAPAPIPPIISGGFSGGFSGCTSCGVTPYYGGGGSSYFPETTTYPSVFGSSCTGPFCQNVNCVGLQCQQMPISPFGTNPLAGCLNNGVGMNPLGLQNPACTAISNQYFNPPGTRYGQPYPYTPGGVTPYYPPGIPPITYGPGTQPIPYSPNPVIPGNPVIPVNPGNPVIPVNPGNPVIPVNPGNPVIPVNPGNPVIPVNPGNPVIPVNPGNPVIPVNPGNPVIPVNPGNPVIPVNPGNPIIPVGPVGVNGQVVQQGSTRYRVDRGAVSTKAKSAIKSK